MDRISGMNYVVVDGLRKFTDSPPGTVLTADWINGLQEELLYIIEEAGLSPDPDDTTQVYEAIQKFIRDYFGGSSYTDFNVKFLRLNYGNNVATAISQIGVSETNYTTLVIDTPTTLTANATFNANTTLWFLGTGKIILGAYNLVIDGGIIASQNLQIFDDVTGVGAGIVTISEHVSEVYPEWWYISGTTYWDAALISAVNAHPKVALCGYGADFWGGAAKRYRLQQNVSLPIDRHTEIVGYGMPYIDTLTQTYYGLDIYGANCNQYMYHIHGIQFYGVATIRIRDTDGAASDQARECFLIENCHFSCYDIYAAPMIYLSGLMCGTIQNCNFQGETTRAYTWAIRRTQCDVTRIVNCSFQFLETGIYDYGGSGYHRGSHILHCRFNDVLNPYYGNTITDIQISGCRISDASSVTAPIRMLGCSQVLIENNSFYYHSTGAGADHAIEVDEASGPTYCYDITIRNNRQTTSGGSYGPTTFMSINEAFGVIIEGNRIDDYDSYGIEMDDVDYARIQNNFIDAGTGTGTTSIRLTNCLNSTCHVVGNQVDNPIVGGVCANNNGYVVRNTGVGTLAISTARVSIAHGLSVTPDWAVITSEEETATLAVAAMNATELTIEALPGTSPACTIYWQAMLTTQTLIN